MGKDKVALVTGASSGIGEASALALATAGATVVVSARRADRLADLVKRIEQAGGKALAIAGDVAVEKDATIQIGFAKAIVAQIKLLLGLGRLDLGGLDLRRGGR